jgi:hypothetical protein
VLTSFLHPFLVLTLRFSPQLTGAEPGINPIIEEELKNIVDNGQQDGAPGERRAEDDLLNLPPGGYPGA